MSGNDAPLLLVRDDGVFSVDLTTLGVSVAALDALDWAGAFQAMAALESGAVANPDEGRQVGHYWLRDATLAPDPAIGEAITSAVQQIDALAARIRSGEVCAPEGPFTDVVHVGIGGSALGPQLLQAALDEGAGLRLHFVDNTDPDGIARTLDAVGDRLATTLVVVVSKSGSTPETVNGSTLVAERMRAAGVDPAPRSIAITGAGSKLDARAQREGWLATFPLWDWVGGRTSVTGPVGLLPAALAGLDTAGLLRGAREMDAWTRSQDWRSNPAAMLAGAWHVVGHGVGERAMVVLPYHDRLLLMSRFLQQLVMESLGKRLDLQGREVHQGLTVYGNKGSTDQHAFVQQLRDGRDDFFVTFVEVLEDGGGSSLEIEGGANAGDFLQGFLLGTRQALADDGRPSLTITLPRVDAAHVGALIALHERAVGLYASLVGINAYHQPGVEAGKKAARAVLELGRSVRGALSSEGQSAEAVAASLGADANQVFHILQRLASTGRATREGAGFAARYRAS